MQVRCVGDRLADLLPKDLGVEQLLAVIPLVEGLRLVLALVALQPQQPAPGRLGQGERKLGLADAGRPLQQHRLAQSGLQEHRRGEPPVGEIPVLGHPRQHVVDVDELRSRLRTWWRRRLGAGARLGCGRQRNS